jgi:hypothetical protein
MRWLKSPGPDLLDVLERLRGFDLENDDLLAVGVRQVFGSRYEAELAVDVATVECAAPDGMEAHPVDDLPCLVGVGDVRHDDAGCVHLERLDVVAVASLGDAHECVDVVDARGTDLVLQSDPVVWHVLRAEPHPVDTAEPGDFHNPWVGKVDLEQ